MNDIAESFVKLVLAVGQHDEDYVDAYFGPPEWREEVSAETLDLDQIRSRASELAHQLEQLAPPAGDATAVHRHASLSRTVDSLIARVGWSY